MSPFILVGVIAGVLNILNIVYMIRFRKKRLECIKKRRAKK